MSSSGDSLNWSFPTTKASNDQGKCLWYLRGWSIPYTETPNLTILAQLVREQGYFGLQGDFCVLNAVKLALERKMTGLDRIA